LKKKILITPVAFSILKEKIKRKYLKKFKFFLVKGPVNNKKILKKYLKNKDGCILGSEKINKEVLSDLRGLKILIRFGVGYENIDINACIKNNIRVVVLPSNVNSDAVARHCLAFLLAITQNLHKHLVERKKWERHLNLSFGKVKLGIIGAGNIGSRFGNYAHKIGFKINYFSRTKKITKRNKKFKYFNNLHNLIKFSDIISLNISSNQKNINFFDKKKIKLLKNKYLINTSRGNLIDENYLYALLKKKVILGAALDVFQYEPTIKISSKLRELKNVISTCHNASYDAQTLENMMNISLNNLENFFYNRNKKINKIIS
jgi:lactate dehydrogenase-like 2-hydroxyacid dehydrogenase